MYKITINAGETYITEKPNFIRKHENGCFVPTDKDHAEGVAHQGTPYLFADGVLCFEFDSGKNLSEQSDTNTLTLEIAADHEERLCMMELGI